MDTVRSQSPLPRPPDRASSADLLACLVEQVCGPDQRAAASLTVVPPMLPPSSPSLLHSAPSLLPPPLRRLLFHRGQSPSRRVAPGAGSASADGGLQGGDTRANGVPRGRRRAAAVRR